MSLNYDYCPTRATLEREYQEAVAYYERYKTPQTWAAVEDAKAALEAHGHYCPICRGG